MSQHIIADVARNISQVDTYAQYNDTSNMTADEIFYGARGDRAYLKELQKAIHKQLYKFTSGANSIELPTANFISALDLDDHSITCDTTSLRSVTGGNRNIMEINKARKLEEFYTNKSVQL